MAKKRNDQRRVQPTLASADANPKGMDQIASTEAGLKKQIEYYGKMRAQVVDISSQMESIFETQQRITQESDRQYGIEKKVLNSLGVYANQVKLISLEKKLLKKLSLEDSNIIKNTISDYKDYNQAAAGVAQKAKELADYRRKQIPFEEKIRGIQQQITNLQGDQTKGLSKAQQERLKNLKTSEDQWKNLSKQEQVNKRIEKIQGSVSELMDGQNSAAGKIFKTMKDIVTNPLTLFVGLLAVGLQRYETMRQRGNELAEEHDRINKKLAGAGPYQDKIIQKATLIRDRFYEMGEGFSSSMEGSVDAVVALSDQFGKIGYVTGNLVKTMAELKLSIGLSDESSAKVLDNFMTVNGLSSEAAIHMTDMTYQMSEQAGLNPQQVFQDIAAASGDTLATFSGSADELAKSAVTARRLGLTLDDMASVSKGLLDFETSIEKEMEAQLITGMDLNFQKARMLAMQGDEAGAMEEVMRQVGGLDKFNKMQPLQQRALADAVGLTVGQLQKTTKMREQEAIHATKKYDLVEKQFALAEKALPMLNKLDVGLGVMERIAVVLGDLFLDVFGGSLKDLEKQFFAFLTSPVFKTGFKNLLYTIKGVIMGIKDAIVGTVSMIDKLSGGAIGGFLKNFGNKDFSGSYGTAEKTGNTLGKGIAVLLAGKLLLGSSSLTPMYVKVTGGIMGGIKGLFNMFKGGAGGGVTGPLTKAGLPDMRYAANKGLGGAMSGGSTMMGMPLGAGLGGTSGGIGTAMGGSLLGTAGAVFGGLGAAALIGKGFYDVANISSSGSLADAKKAKSGRDGAVGGALAGAAIGSFIPVVGTLLGAGIGAAIGYFGNRSLSASKNYMTNLEQSESDLIERQQETSRAFAVVEQARDRRQAKRQLSAEKSFDNLAKNGEVTGESLEQLSKDLVDTGLISKGVFRRMARDGKITSAEMKKALASITGSMRVVVTGKNAVTQEQIVKLEEVKTTNIEVANQLNALTTTLRNGDLIGALVDIADPLQSGADVIGAETNENFSLNNPNLIGKGNEDANTALRRMKIGSFTDGKLSDDEISKILEQSYRHVQDIYYEMSESKVNEIGSKQLETDLANAINRSIIAKLSEKERQSSKAQLAVEKAIDKLPEANKTNANDIITQIDETGKAALLEQKRNNDILQLNKDYGGQDWGDGEGVTMPGMNYGVEMSGPHDQYFQSNVDFASDRYFTALQEILAKTSADYKQRGGILANGGITYGPSHAQGGIPTKYGELEGGEAIINKRSTAMFRNELSNLNVAGGGTSFAKGGVTRKFQNGGYAHLMSPEMRDQLNTPEGGYSLSSLSDFAGVKVGKAGVRYHNQMYNPQTKQLGNYTDVLDHHQRNYGMGVTWGLLGQDQNAYQHRKAYELINKYGANAYRTNDYVRNQLGMDAYDPRRNQIDKNIGLPRYGVEGNRKTNKEMSADLSNVLSGSGITTMQNVAMAVTGAKGLQSAFKGLNSTYQLAKYVGWKQMIPTMVKTLSAAGPLGGTKIALGNAYGLNVVKNSAMDVYDTAKHLLTPGSEGNVGVNGNAPNNWIAALGKIEEGKYTSAGMKSLSEYYAMQYEKDPSDYKAAILKYTAGLTGQYLTPMLDKALGFYNPDENHARGGVMPNSPIKKVNDMILTKDGQMIETHADDNLIAKKGAITQNKSGGSGEGRMEALLEGILHAIQAGGDTYIDGAKVSAAINQSNYNV